MSDVPISKTTSAVQAYRWLVAWCMGIPVILAQRTAAGIDVAAKDGRALLTKLRTMRGVYRTVYARAVQVAESLAVRG